MKTSLQQVQNLVQLQAVFILAKELYFNHECFFLADMILKIPYETFLRIARYHVRNMI